MNYAQFTLFLFYLLSLFLSGVGIYSILNKSEVRFNKIVCIGESLLLGSILIVGQLFILSLLHLYKNPYLWGAVFFNYSFILSGNVRKLIFELLSVKFRFNSPVIIFIVLIGVLVFRNLYFLIDVDSLSTYLFTQKLWLNYGTSLFGNSTNDIRIFVPQFDAVPYSLGISIFGQETLFPQLVNLLWRIISVLLVFGYTKYRFNGYYALAASFFVVFNDHFFYSGANQWVIINAALIAFIFAAVYNFWEARVKNSTCHLVFALIFLSQIMANKYQILLTFLFLLLIGITIQPELFKKVKEIFRDKRYSWPVLAAFSFMFLWYFKNFIVTGNPAFPLLSGKLHSFGWTQEQSRVFAQLIGGLSPLKFLKFASFLFVWPGVNPAKYVLISIFILPFIIFISATKQKTSNEEIAEICFWLGACVLLLFGLCLATWQEPRYYRFLIALFSFSAVLSLRFSIKSFLNIKNEFIPAVVILCFSFQGYSIINKGGMVLSRPTIKENIDIALNRIHMDYIIKKHHPEVTIILDGIRTNKDKFDSSAWFTSDDTTSAFLLPDRPKISLLCTTTIKWDSYSREELVINDLKKNGIKWIMTFSKNSFVFSPIEEFAKEAVKFNRSPRRIMFDYGFPDELTRIN